jgi:hypothetical protein
MVSRLFLMVVLISGSYVYAQEKDCKVKISELSGTYSGGCKNGLAHGKGIAQGKDRYAGQFTKGVPDGKGTYTWSDGTYYEGQWRDGRRDGMGKLVKGDSLVTGYWKDDRYMGEKLIPPYTIIKSLSVGRSTITKTMSTGNGVRIKIMLGGSENTSVEDLTLAYDSGNEYRMSNTYGIQNATFPVYIKIMYRTWNPFHTIQYQVIFEFIINESGTWDVVLFN